ncbi:hypothetical protein [Marinilactibacillus psychrotolerans]|uniref:Apea-like HEPN domain-containing protein n=1 Tax=Marinilactibacillus psychrotolerans TaxID=191770 RepID=A0ABW8UMB0_9LACT
MKILNLMGELKEEVILSQTLDIRLRPVSMTLKEYPEIYSDLVNIIYKEFLNEYIKENLDNAGTFFILEKTKRVSMIEKKINHNINSYSKLISDKYASRNSIALLFNEIYVNLDFETNNVLNNNFAGYLEKELDEIYLAIINFLKPVFNFGNKSLNSFNIISDSMTYSTVLQYTYLECFRIRQVEQYTSLQSKFEDELNDLVCFQPYFDKMLKLETEKTIFILKYLPEGNGEVNEFLSMISILELLKRKSHNWTEEERIELAKYLNSSPKNIDNNIAEVKLILQIRNKLVHAEYYKLSKLLKEYRQKYIVNFWFDTSELTLESWTFGRINSRITTITQNVLLDFFGIDNRKRADNERFMTEQLP